MSSSRRRPCRSTLPIRFARPSLEMLEQRLPPGDLSFIWILGTTDTPGLQPHAPPLPTVTPPPTQSQPVPPPIAPTFLASPPAPQPAPSAPASQPAADVASQHPADLALLAGLFQPPASGQPLATP